MQLSASWCSNCLARIEPVCIPVCTRCGRAMLHPLSRTCLGCTAHKPAFRSLRTAFFYSGPVRDAALRFKHSGKMEMAARLADILLAHLRPCLDLPPDLIASVPMFPTRLLRRGYNQAALLADHVSSALSVPHRPILVRTRNTGSQEGRNTDQRHANVAGAFAVPKPDLVQARTILLVDDVVASGATASECASALMSAGASAVDVWALARPH